MSAAPRVSVIIPAYRARGTLPAALWSVAASGLPPDQVEVVIAPDDGDSYDDLPEHGLRLTRCDHHHVATGAGPARNRGLAAARGRLVAFLDADDTWEPGYLAALLPLTATRGAAFGQTCIMAGETPILRLPGPGQDRLRIADMGRTGASFHPVARRELVGPFVAHPSQDVLHSIEVLALCGGACPLARVAYRLHLSRQSATAADDFAERLDTAYAGHIARIEAGQSRVPPPLVDTARAAFEAKGALNRAYRQTGAGRLFYQFMAERLRAAWQGDQGRTGRTRKPA